MLSYAAVPLLLDTTEHEEFVAKYYDWSLRRDTENSGWLGTDIDHLPLPPLPDDGPVRIGVLRWPTGASRCATFHALIDGTRLAEIRDAVGNPADYADLVFGDGVNDDITVSMRMLPTPVIHDTGSGDESKNLYLLTLVDQRFDWRWKVADIEETPASWSSLFSTLATALDISISTDTISGDFDAPSRRWIQYHKPLPTLLDAAAAAVQQRVVVALDGSVSTVNYDTAQADADAQYEDVRKLIGGRIEQTDFQRTAPASVDVVFGQEIGGQVQTDPYTVTVNLADLSITGYGSVTGIAGLTKTLFADLVFDATNTTACDDFANALATAWYGWYLSDLDFSAPGLLTWEPTGSEDAVEWQYQHGGRLLTRIVLSEFAHQQYGGYGGLGGGRGSFEARLTSSGGSPTKWKFVPLLILAGAETETATETEAFCATAYPADSTTDNTWAHAGLRVRMWPTGEVIDGVAQYEFDSRWAYASSTQGGTVSTSIQNFAGLKTFIDGAQTATYTGFYPYDHVAGFSPTAYADEPQPPIYCFGVPPQFHVDPAGDPSIAGPHWSLGNLAGTEQQLVVVNSEIDAGSYGSANVTWFLSTHTPSEGDYFDPLVVFTGRLTAIEWSGDSTGSDYVYNLWPGIDGTVGIGGKVVNGLVVSSGFAPTALLTDVNIYPVMSGGFVTSLTVWKTFYDFETCTTRVICAEIIEGNPCFDCEETGTGIGAPVPPGLSYVEETDCATGTGIGSGTTFPPPISPPPNSPPPPCTQTITQLGTATASAVGTSVSATVAGITTSAGEVLVVTFVTQSDSATAAVPTVDWMGGDWGSIGWKRTQNDRNRIQTYITDETGTDDVVVSLLAGGVSETQGIIVSVAKVSGATLSGSSLIQNNGTSSVPASGPYTTGVACCHAIGFIIQSDSSPVSNGTWADSFTALSPVAGSSGFPNTKMQVGYRALTSDTMVDAKLSAPSSAQWAACLGTVSNV